jgi:hypothetical protein
MVRLILGYFQGTNTVYSCQGNEARVLAKSPVLGVDLGQGFERGGESNVTFFGLCGRVPEFKGDVLTLVACLQKGVDLLSRSFMLLKSSF